MKEGNVSDDGMYILWEVSTALSDHNSNAVLIMYILWEGNACAEKDLGEGESPEEVCRYGCGAHFGELALLRQVMTSSRRLISSHVTISSSLPWDDHVISFHVSISSCPRWLGQNTDSKRSATVRALGGHKSAPHITHCLRLSAGPHPYGEDARSHRQSPLRTGGFFSPIL